MDPLVAPHLKVLEELRRQAVEMVRPLDDEQINRPVPGLSNTVGVLLRHLAGSERYWVGEVVGGRAAHRNRDAEFAREPLRKATLLADLEDVGALTAEVLAQVSPEDLTQVVEVRRTRGVLRETKLFAVLHAVQHLAYHVGQLRYLTRWLEAPPDR